MRAIDIVRHRRERTRQANSRSRRLSRAAVTVALVALLGAVLAPLLVVAAAAGGLLVFLADLPDVTALEQLPGQYRPSSAASYLYAWDEPAADGSRPAVIIDTITDPRSGGAGWMRLADLPPQAAVAFLAGIDPSLGAAKMPTLAEELRAAWASGAIPTPPSPLTAALVRDHLRGRAPVDSSHRAWQDWFLARQIAGQYSPEQQLEWALNTAYFGNLAYGLDAAARVYFGKGAAELTAAEAAALATAARDPAANPHDDPVGSRLGQAAILSAMASAGAISTADAEAALDASLTLAPPPGSDALSPAFGRQARRELESILGPERLLAGGWQVETTLDLALQAQVDCVQAAPGGTGGGPPCPAREFLTDVAGPQAVVAIRPATGALRAISGDALAPHPTGTLTQPLVYLTALSQGYNAATLTQDVPSIYLQDGRPYSPRNAGGDFLGPLRLREAMATGRLVPATQVLSWVGPAQVLATARGLGLEPGAGADLTLPETGFPASLLDLGRAFAAIANGGTMAGGASAGEPPRPATIQRVTSADGRQVYAHQPAARETLSPALAYLVTDILSDAEARCPQGDCPAWPALPGEQAAAMAAGHSLSGDAWAIGYTPDLLVGVLSPGGESAAETWRGLMGWAANNAPPAAWPRPVGLQAVEVCAVSGLLPSRGANCPTAREWFVPGTEPSAIDDMVRVVAVNRETGRLATIFTPPHLIERRAYIDYPPEAAAWAEAAGVERPPTEYDTIRRIPTRDGGAALSVEPWAVVSGQYPVVGSAGGEDFAYYRLAFFPGLLPEAMQTLIERGETPVESAELTVWDTTLVEDGLYTLLLTVVREDGTFDEVAVPVTVANE